MVDREPPPPEEAESPDDSGVPGRHGHSHDAATPAAAPSRDPLRILAEAAIEAERQTGTHEQSDRDAQRSLAMRIVRAFAGFVIIGIGIGALPLPGPGWLIIIIGLGLLPFAWAERTVRLIRRKVPGVPEEGGIPVTTWIVIGIAVAASIAISILFGDAISSWVAGLWGDPDTMLGMRR